MSARFFQRPDISNSDGHRVVSAALLVAVAMNPSAQAFSSWDDLVNPPPSDVGASAPPSIEACISNSVDLLHGVEGGQEKPTFVPSFLHPNSSTVKVDEMAIQEITSAVSKCLPDSELQTLINERFPANDFSQHLFTHLRALASTSFPGSSEADEQVKAPNIETTVALKQIEVAQRWFAAHFRTVAQIMRASLYFASQVSRKDDGTFSATSRSNPQSFTWSAFSVAEVSELHSMSKHFKDVEDQMVSKIRDLRAKLDPQSEKEWKDYAAELGFETWGGLRSFVRVQRKLYAVMWMLKYGPPKFFANHRNEFAEVADLLTQYGGETDGPSTHLLKNLSFLGRAMRDLSLTAEDLEPFEKHCDALVAHKFYKDPTEAFPARKSS